MILRIASLLTLLVAGLAPAGVAAVAWEGRSHDGVMLAVSRALMHRDSAAVVKWAATQPGVRTAALGRDRETVCLTFTDGQQAAILPRTLRIASRTGPAFSPRFRRLQTAPVYRGRAMVAEPFATQLKLGSTAGDVEVRDLEYAGFKVDQAYDGAVTVNFMRSMSQYNIFYMLTHSGVNQYGEGVIATGQLANGDPAVEALIPEQSVLKVGVVGSNDIYYGVMSHFLTAHLPPFPAHALVFLNGCALLKASLIWQSLQDRGAAAMVSWEQDGLAVDDSTAAGAFFAGLVQRQSIEASMAALKAAGYGVSTVDGHTARFGYLGDGSLTLDTISPPPATSTPAPATPMPTATIPPATATSTAVPVANLRLLPAVRPGDRQIISMTVAPGQSVHLTVRFPNGDLLRAQGAADSSGQLLFSFRQPGSSIIHGDETASVTARAGADALTQTYRILYGPLDVSAVPRRVSGTHVEIWVHSAAHVTVQVRLSAAPAWRRDLVMHTGPHGWAHHRVELGVHHPRGTIVVRAGRTASGALYRAKTDFTVV